MPCNSFTPVFNRRDLLKFTAAGFGSLALAGLVADEAWADAVAQTRANPLALKPPHFEPKAKREIGRAHV